MQLTPEQVNEFIAKAVLESQIGDVVKASVDRVLGELKKSYQNPFDAVITQEVTALIRKELKATYQPILEEKIKTAMAIWATDESMDKIVDAAVERLKRNY